jgi:hypothetical protein
MASEIHPEHLSHTKLNHPGFRPLDRGLQADYRCKLPKVIVRPTPLHYANITTCAGLKNDEQNMLSKPGNSVAKSMVTWNLLMIG